MIQSKIEIKGSRTHRVVFFPKVAVSEMLAAFFATIQTKVLEKHKIIHYT